MLGIAVCTYDSAKKPERFVVWRRSPYALSLMSIVGVSALGRRLLAPCLCKRLVVAIIRLQTCINCLLGILSLFINRHSACPVPDPVSQNYWVFLASFASLFSRLFLAASGPDFVSSK